MKKKVVILTTLLTAALAAGGFLYFTHTQALKKAAPAAASAPPPAASVLAGAVTHQNKPVYLKVVETLIPYNTDIVLPQIPPHTNSTNLPQPHSVPTYT